MRVLIADDEAKVAEVLAGALRDAGYEVDLAQDSKTAIDQLSHAQFDIVLCDWMMPDAEGTEIIQHVRQAMIEQPLVLLLSGMHGTQVRPEAMASGADDYVTKPCPPNVMLDAIASGLSRRAHARSDVVRSSLRPPPAPLAEPRTTRVSILPSAPVPREIAVQPARRADASHIEATAAWHALSENLAGIFAHACDTELRGAPAAHREPGQLLAGAVSMVDVHRNVEVAVALYVPWESGVELARRILRDPAPDEVAIRELLVEMGTNASAGLSAALERDGYRFTLGLGQSCTVSDPGVLMRSFSASFSAVFSGNALRLTSVVGARTVSPTALPGKRLRDGMVLAEDVWSDDNELLFSAGTRVAASTAERIVRVIPTRFVRVHLPPERW
jgi:DNA-binding response OmpR family regulator